LGPARAASRVLGWRASSVMTMTPASRIAVSSSPAVGERPGANPDGERQPISDEAQHRVRNTGNQETREPAQGVISPDDAIQPRLIFQHGASNLQRCPYEGSTRPYRGR